jgi:A/G-specific adenine glycosylase
MTLHRSGDHEPNPGDAPSMGCRLARSTAMPSTVLADRATRWYAKAARDLPWRRPGTSAWGVLTSEVMLQQTPAARVEPVYVEWMRRWPTPADLAAEPAGAAIRAWGRLGYPRRALRLHQCAGVLVAEYGGVVPAELVLLLGLPGVGAYTARAVAAFAYGQRQPVVDTNVRRLVARAHHGRADGGPATTTQDLQTVTALLPRQPIRAARASVAFMELGALVCTARTPSCVDCPLQTVCAWHRSGHPPPVGTRRRSQGYAGTDRQARGVLMALARTGPVRADEFAAAWPDQVQLTRALHGLLEDGLLVKAGRDRYELP